MFDAYIQECNQSKKSRCQDSQQLISQAFHERMLNSPSRAILAFYDLRVKISVVESI